MSKSRFESAALVKRRKKDYRKVEGDSRKEEGGSRNMGGDSMEDEGCIRKEEQESRKGERYNTYTMYECQALIKCSLFTPFNT